MTKNTRISCETAVYKTASKVALLKTTITNAILQAVIELCFSVRSQNALKRASIFTVGEVINALNQEQIEKIRNLGRKSICEIKTRILQFGFDQLSDGEKVQFFSTLIDLNPEKTAEICASVKGQKRKSQEKRLQTGMPIAML